MSLEKYGTTLFFDALFDAGAVGFNPPKAMLFKSGILSPGAYINNRRIQSDPKSRAVIHTHMTDVVGDISDELTTIASVATGGTAHGCAIAYRLGRPHVSVKQKPKEHGYGGLIDGDETVVCSRDVVLVEDMSSTFQSSLDAMAAIEAAGGNVIATVTINTWKFPAFDENTKGKKVYTGATGRQLVEVALDRKHITQSYHDLLLHWLKHPEDKSWLRSQYWDTSGIPHDKL